MYEKLSAVNGGDYDVVLASDYMLNTTREAADAAVRSRHRG